MSMRLNSTKIINASLRQSAHKFLRSQEDPYTPHCSRVQMAGRRKFAM